LEGGLRHSERAYYFAVLLRVWTEIPKTAARPKKTPQGETIAGRTSARMMGWERNLGPDVFSLA